MADSIITIAVNGDSLDAAETGNLKVDVKKRITKLLARYNTAITFTE